MIDLLARWLFWLSFATLVYAYVAFPLGVWLAARIKPRPLCPLGPPPTNVSILLAARNEASHMRRRLTELVDVLGTSGLTGEVIVVSDGSHDATAEIAREFSARGVRVVEWEENRGKAAALSHAAALAQYDVLALADARQRWDQDALPKMLENFADPTVGAVSGSLHLEVRPGVLAGVGFYWKFEKWLRDQESRRHSLVNVTGAISAVRRSLFRPIPQGMLIDDMYWPMQVVMQGYRVVHDERAKAYDRLPDSARGEMRRKVRTLAGIFQLVAEVPALLVPWRNPAWVTFVSHKLLRLAAPWAMLGTLIAACIAQGSFYRLALVAQLIALLAAVWGMTTKAGGRQRICAAAGSFLLLHAAAWLAFWMWLAGGTGRLWRNSQYAPAVLDGAPPT